MVYVHFTVKNEPIIREKMHRLVASSTRSMQKSIPCTHLSHKKLQHVANLDTYTYFKTNNEFYVFMHLPQRL